MKNSLLILAVILSSLAVAQDTKATSETAIASGPVTPCVSQADRPDTDAKHECEKRDTARLFLIAGKPEAALRMLCVTTEARAAFGDDKNGTPVKCLKSVGVVDSGK
jgi:hypothetical protein